MKTLLRCTLAATTLAAVLASVMPSNAQGTLTVRKARRAAVADVPYVSRDFYSGVYIGQGGVYFYDPGTVLFFKALGKVI